jgi:hypothetical protein
MAHPSFSSVGTNVFSADVKRPEREGDHSNPLSLYNAEPDV